MSSDRYAPSYGEEVWMVIDLLKRIAEALERAYPADAEKREEAIAAYGVSEETLEKLTRPAADVARDLRTQTARNKAMGWEEVIDNG